MTKPKQDWPKDEEGKGWDEMPFVTDESSWAPAVMQSDDINTHTSQWAVGAYCAASFIGHIKRFSAVDAYNRLPDVVDAMFKGRALGTIERAFLTGLSQFIAHGRVTFSTDFDVVPADGAWPSDGDDTTT